MIPLRLQKKILIFLTVFFVPLFVLVWGPDIYGLLTGKPPAQTPPKGNSAPAKASAESKAPAKGKSPAAKNEVTLDLLAWNRDHEALEEGAHNPFARLSGYEEPPPPKVAKTKPPPPPPPPDPFIEELKTFKYFGFAVDEKKRVAFLSKGNQSYTAKEKDILDDKFLLKKITEEYVVIGEPRGPKEMTIAQAGFGEGAGAARPGVPGGGSAPTFVRPPVTSPPPTPYRPPTVMPPKAGTPTAPGSPSTPPMPPGRGARGRVFPTPGQSPHTQGGTNQ